MDDPLLAPFGKYKYGGLRPGYGEMVLFYVGRDDVHGVLLALISAETMGFKWNMFGYDDDELNGAIETLMANPNVVVQGTLDRSQAGGVHERAILAGDLVRNPEFYNSIAVGTSATHQISHTKGGVLVAQGIGFEGSTNWSASGEGTGTRVDLAQAPVPGVKAQNNTLMLFTNPVAVREFSQRLDAEHITALGQQLARHPVAPVSMEIMAEVHDAEHHGG